MNVLSGFHGAVWLGWLAGVLVAQSAMAIPPIVSHVSDPAGLLATERLGVTDLEAKLADYEARTGVRILVQFHAKAPPTDEDRVPGAYMRALSEQLGTRPHGVLLVYFADDPDWRIWIGDDLAATFAGKPGTVAELTASKAIHEVKEALLSAAQAKADAAFTELQKTSAPGQQPSKAHHLELWTEALVDALMARLKAP
jgi:uncharacterized membrane protein YgcG